LKFSLVFPNTPEIVISNNQRARTWDSLQIGSQGVGNRRDPVQQVYFKQLVDFWQGVREDDAGGLILRYEGDWGTNSPVIGVAERETELYNSCLSKMYDKIRGQIDLAVEAAQAGQTKGMVSGATKVVKFISDIDQSVHRGRPYGVVSEFLDRTGRKFNKTKTTAELWLEYQYGWKPLVQTVFDCADRLVRPAQSDKNTLLILKTRASWYDLIDVNRTSPSQGPFKETVTGAFSQRAEMMTQWRIPPTALTFLSEWSSMNPGSIAWEVLPFSFVVDWFVDIGGYIRNLESAFLYQSSFVRGYHTYTSSYDTATVISEASAAGSCAMRSKFSVRKKSRAVMSVAPFPKLPTFAPKLGWQRLVSAAGLLAGFLGKPKR
jgi:hypothetical protein